MKVRVCPLCGSQNPENAWYCETPGCGQVLSIDTIFDLDMTTGDLKRSINHDTPIEIENSKDEISQSELGAVARAGLFMGGLLGGVLGLVVYGVIYLFFQITKMPIEIMDFLKDNWDKFLWGGLILGAFIVGFILTIAVQKASVK